jgi:hypothetical protein
VPSNHDAMKTWVVVVVQLLALLYSDLDSGEQSVSYTDLLYVQQNNTRLLPDRWLGGHTVSLNIRCVVKKENFTHVKNPTLFPRSPSP